jgi:hypothetical protein
MITPEQIIGSTLMEGCVYYIRAPELIETNVHHYFLVLAIDGSDNFIMMSTTKIDRLERHIQRNDYDYKTVVHIAPNGSVDGNGLTEDSYFNCNEYHTITREELINKVKTDKLKPKGRFSKHEYTTIIEGISHSNTMDIPSSYFKYDDERIEID